MKYATFIYTIILLPQVLSAQQQLHLRGVVGSYAMGDMKTLQSEIRSDYYDLNIPVETMLDFPASLQVEAGHLMSFNNELDLGYFANYTYTKGSLHYADYSGNVHASQLLRRILIGVEASVSLNNSHVHLYGKAGVNFSWLELAYKTEITGAGTQQENVGFHAIGFCAEPGIRFVRPLFKPLLLEASAGYAFNINDKTYHDEVDEAYLANANDEALFIDWSGYRISLGLAIVISQ